MAELLIEILTEEIPARMQRRGAEALREQFVKEFESRKIPFKSVEAYVTPRRLALVAHDIAPAQSATEEEKRGPRKGAPKAAIEGFLKGHNLREKDCTVRKTPKGAFYFAVIKKQGQSLEKVVQASFQDILLGIPWPKSMRWAHFSDPWVRPIQSLLCLIGGKVVTLPNPYDLPTGGQTVGHRFLSSKPFPVENFQGYRQKLADHKVVLDHTDRMRLILKQADQLAATKGVALVKDDGLLIENAGLTEWPVCYMGAIDQTFLSLPEEVLTTTMKVHQRYFACRTGLGHLAPYFVCVSNMETGDEGKTIIRGNENVLRARFSDAAFCEQVDHQTPLSTLMKRLDGLVFHQKLGSMGEKSQRMASLMKRVGVSLLKNKKAGDGKEDTKLWAAAGLLAKADLTSAMVGEFPELQGTMGRYYIDRLLGIHHKNGTQSKPNNKASQVIQDALLAKLCAGTDQEAHKGLGKAIAQQYRPKGPKDDLPSTLLGKSLALVDRLDTLVGFFMVGIHPTGSKDPYALRRAALGCIRLLQTEAAFDWPLEKLFEWAYEEYERQSFPSGALIRQELMKSLLTFFKERLTVYWREQGLRYDLVDAVFQLSRGVPLYALVGRVKALTDFLSHGDGGALLTAYRRANNIVKIEEEKMGKKAGINFSDSLFKQPEEEKLAEALKKTQSVLRDALKKGDYPKAFKALAALRPPVDAFFNQVTVNVKEDPLRLNRLRLLSAVSAILEQVADFSKVMVSKEQPKVA